MPDQVPKKRIHPLTTPFLTHNFISRQHHPPKVSCNIRNPDSTYILLVTCRVHTHPTKTSYDILTQIVRLFTPISKPRWRVNTIVPSCVCIHLPKVSCDTRTQIERTITYHPYRTFVSHSLSATYTHPHPSIPSTKSLAITTHNHPAHPPHHLAVTA